MRLRERVRALLRRDGGDEETLREPVQEWSCDCGQAFRTTGSGRHVVYWVKDAPEGDPVMSGKCPSCERELPGEHAA
jgi:hypothetical protein